MNEVPGITGAVSLVGNMSRHGATTCAIRYTGSVRCWGAIIDGDPRRPYIYTARLIDGASNVRQVALTDDSICLLHSNGQVYCSGLQDFFNIGQFQRVQGIGNAHAIVGAYNAICVKDVDVNDGRPKCFDLDQGVAREQFDSNLYNVKYFANDSFSCVATNDNEVDCDGWNPNIKLLGGEKPVMFNPPRSLAMETSSYTSITVAFDPVDSVSTGFDVYYRKAGDSSWIRSTDEVDLLGRVRITGLKHSTRYEVRMRGKTWASYTKYSSVLSAKTLALN
jgi:hypothetical protein